VSDSYAALWGKKAQNNNTVKTYTGALPAELENTVAGSLVSYKIWGNTGGVGVKKTNLAEGEQLLKNASMNSTGEIVSTSQNYAFRLIPVVKGKTYSIVNIYGAETSESANFYAFFETLPQIGSVAYNEIRYSFKTPSRTFIAPITGYLATSDYYPMYEEQHSNLIPLEVYEGNASPYYLPITLDITEIMGLEPLCGIGTYKDSLDLSTGVLTRRIRRLVLTGEENWRKDSDVGQSARYYVYVSSIENNTQNLLSSHFTQSSGYEIGTINVYRKICVFSVDKTLYPTTDDFKSYLASQYAAGSPVTLWYVLAEPETSTIPVPSGLTGTIEGYLIQDGTPTPENPIYPSENDLIQTEVPIYIGREALGKDEYVDSESGKIYRIVVGALTPTDPPVSLPQIPTFAPTTTISYGGGIGVQPEKVEFKYKVKR